MWTKWLIWIVLYTYLGLSQSNEADDSIFCKSGWRQFRDKCYKLGGKEISERLDREQAAAKCISEGGKLATIASKEVQEFMEKFQLQDREMGAWIGMITKNSGFYWDDGSTISYTNWKPNENIRPNPPYAYCVAMLLSDENIYRPVSIGKWTTVYPCSSKFAYICMDETSLSQSGGALDSTFCKSGWAQYRDKCYKLKGSKGHYLSRDRAAADCFHEDGNLVTIGSKEVQEFLVHFLVSDLKWNVWIGLKRNNSGSYWDDGSNVKYTNWMSKNPTGGGTHPYVDCAAMKFFNVQTYSNPGEWSTGFTCSSSFAYICMAELSCPSYKVAVIISITLVVFLLVILVVSLGSVIYYFRTKEEKNGRPTSCGKF